MTQLGSSPSDASLEKKRARDRRAQQALRSRRLSQLRSLEERNDELAAELQQLQQTCARLRRENEILKAGGILSGMISTSSSTPPHLVSCSEDRNIAMPIAMPPWNMTPAHSDFDRMITDCFNEWLERPDLVHACPDSPATPLDFMYGSKTNFLANLIHDAMRHWPCCDPERLAIGWLIYHFLKWLVRPTETRFARLPAFQTPVSEQLVKPHPYFVDFLPWAQLRANLVCQLGHKDNQGKSHYDVRHIMGMLCCCMKLRWPWGRNFLEPQDDGKLAMHPDFVDTFTRVDGWALTADFGQRYPELVEGMDLAAINYDFKEATVVG